LWAPSDFGEELSSSFATALILANVGGVLASIMLSVHIIHEKSRHVYELFLIRPIRRKDIIISKFLAVFVCVTIASVLAFLLGMAMDYLFHGGVASPIFKGAVESFALGILSVAIACSMGVFIGVVAPTVLVGVIIVIFLSSNISSLTIMIPTMLKLPNSFLLSAMSAVVLSVVFLVMAILAFNRKQF